MMSIDDYISKIAIPKMFSDLDMSYRDMVQSYIGFAPYSIFLDTYQRYVDGFDNMMAGLNAGAGLVPSRSIGNGGYDERR